MGGKKGGYGNSELHHRQGQMGDLEQVQKNATLGGFGDGLGPLTAGASMGDHHRWKLLLLPLLLCVVGLILFFTPWLPGLGAFLIMGAMLALPVVLLQAYLGA